VKSWIRRGRVARDFFAKYQDRILFGKDAHKPEEYACYWGVLEINVDNRRYRAFRQLYGTDLPMIALQKV
jgi:uncharacterized protein